MFDPRQLTSYLDSDYPGRPALHRVIGQVALWGTVIECERGWRASRGYPEQLYVPAAAEDVPRSTDSIACALAAYGVPVELVPAATTTELVGELVKPADWVSGRKPMGS